MKLLVIGLFSTVTHKKIVIVPMLLSKCVSYKPYWWHFYWWGGFFASITVRNFLLFSFHRFSWWNRVSHLRSSVLECFLVRSKWIEKEWLRYSAQLLKLVFCKLRHLGLKRKKLSKNLVKTLIYVPFWIFFFAQASLLTWASARVLNESRVFWSSASVVCRWLFAYWIHRLCLNNKID